MLNLQNLNNALLSAGQKDIQVQGILIEPFEYDSGASVANQYIIKLEHAEGVLFAFQSYETIIALKDDYNFTILDIDALDYSRTTLKFLKLFIGDSSPKKILKDKISNGIYHIYDLNCN